MPAKEEAQRVGDLNGMWAMLFKIVMAVTLPWMSWISIELMSLKMWRSAVTENRFTSADAHSMKAELQEYVRDNAPPPWLDKMIHKHDKALDDLKKFRVEMLQERSR